MGGEVFKKFVGTSFNDDHSIRNICWHYDRRDRKTVVHAEIDGRLYRVFAPIGEDIRYDRMMEELARYIWNRGLTALIASGRTHTWCGVPIDIDYIGQSEDLWTPDTTSSTASALIIEEMPTVRDEDTGIPGDELDKFLLSMKRSVK